MQSAPRSPCSRSSSICSRNTGTTSPALSRASAIQFSPISRFNGTSGRRPRRFLPTSTRLISVLILADDLGYNDITFNGGGVAAGAVPTPNINSIAHEGVAFTNGYAGNATWLEGPIDIDHPLSYLKSASDEYVF